MKSPCYQCISRYPACHSDCGKYAAFRAEIDEQQKLRRREYDLRDYEKRTAARMLKRAHNRKGGGRYDQ